eukprot:gene4461-5472_t
MLVARRTFEGCAAMLVARRIFEGCGVMLVARRIFEGCGAMLVARRIFEGCGVMLVARRIFEGCGAMLVARRIFVTCGAMLVAKRTFEGCGAMLVAWRTFEGCSAMLVARRIFEGCGAMFVTKCTFEGCGALPVERGTSEARKESVNHITEGKEKNEAREVVCCTWGDYYREQGASLGYAGRFMCHFSAIIVIYAHFEGIVLWPILFIISYDQTWVFVWDNAGPAVATLAYTLLTSIVLKNMILNQRMSDGTSMYFTWWTPMILWCMALSQLVEGLLGALTRFIYGIAASVSILVRIGDSFFPT